MQLMEIREDSGLIVAASSAVEIPYIVLTVQAQPALHIQTIAANSYKAVDESVRVGICSMYGL